MSRRNKNWWETAKFYGRDAAAMALGAPVYLYYEAAPIIGPQINQALASGRDVLLSGAERVMSGNLWQQPPPVSSRASPEDLELGGWIQWPVIHEDYFNRKGFYHLRRSKRSKKAKRSARRRRQ